MHTSTKTSYPEFRLNDFNLAELPSISATAIDKIIDTYNEHHILIFRNQNLNEEQLITIAKLFGEPAQALVPTFRLEKFPVITRHSNMKDAENLPKGVVAPEYVFHADSYFAPNPTKATIFYSLQAPNIGGETHFVDMCEVYDSLDNQIKMLIQDKRVSYKNAFINQPPATHPMVRVHPVTGKKALFVNKHRALGIDGMEHDDAIRLVTDLYHHATSPRFVHKHKWRQGDLIVWNNVATMHSATPIPDTEERLLYRILTKGDLPVV